MQAPTLHHDGSTFDVADTVRAVRELQAPDARDLVRGLEAVPDLAGAALEAAGESLRETVHRMSAPPRRSGPSTRGWITGLAVTIAVLGAAAWTWRRMTAMRPARRALPAGPPVEAEAARLDREAIERAAGEGMGVVESVTEREMGMRAAGPGIVEHDGRDAPVDDTVVRPMVGINPASQR
jgi:hypothetical protein